MYFNQFIKSFFALFLGLFVFGTQLNAQNISDVVPSLNSVVGLTGLPVTNVVKKSNSVSGDVTIHGNKSLLVGFKVNGKSMGALLFHQGITLGDVVPSLKGKPTDDIELKKVAFIFVPPNNAQTNVSVSSLPTPVQHMIGKGVTTINLHKGLNIFSQAGVKDGSKLETMLKKVHAYKDSYSLIGTLSPKLFSRNSGTDIKNEILDGLDIHIGLPKLSFPGLPKAVTIKNSKLTITAPTVEGKREIDLSVNGDLVAKAGSSTVDFEYEIDFKKQKGDTSDISITGHTAKGVTTTINMIEKLSLSDMSFDVHKQSNGWMTKVSGNSTFRGKQVKAEFSHITTYTFLTVYPKMTLAKILGEPSIPVLDDINPKVVWIYKNRMVMSVDVKGIPSYFITYKPNGEKKYHVAFSMLKNFTANQLIPDADNTPLKDVTFEKLAFIYNPNKTNEQYKTDTGNGYIAAALSYIKKDVITLKPGLNVFGHINIHPKGEIATLLKDVGVTDVRFPLNGTFSPQSFAKNLNAGSIKKEILSNLDIDIKLPALKIPEIDKVLTFYNGNLKIKGNNSGIDMSLSGDGDFHIKHEILAFKVNIDYDKTKSGTDLSFKGSTKNRWVHPDGIKFLTLDSLKLNIDKKKNSKGGKTLDIKIIAKTDIGKHSRLDIDVDIHEINGKITDIYFELDGPIKASEIPGIKNIPHSDKFTLKKLIITKDGVQADSVLNKKAVDFYAFHTNNSWNFALTQTDFKITELLPPLKNTPLKHIRFPYAAVIFSENGINEPYSSLTKVGQDALNNIFTGNEKSTIKVNKGVELIAGFHPDNTGALKEGVKGIGVKDGAIVIGKFSGLFGGEPNINLTAKLNNIKTSKHMPKGSSYKSGEEIEFFINVDKSGQDFVFELGIGVGVYTKIKGDNLLFDSKVFMKIMDEGFGIDVTGSMQGKWVHPLGMPALTLEDVTFLLGMEENGGVNIGYTGTTILGSDKISMATDATLLPEALGFPQDLAFKGSADEIPVFFLESVALSMVGKESHFKMPTGILPVLKKAKFAFVSPGAEAPELGIMSEGFALNGDLNWLDTTLGSMHATVSPTAINAKVTLKINQFIAGTAKRDLTDILNDMNSGFADAQKALTKAQNKVDSLTTKLNAKRAKIRKARAKIEAKVQNAENRVNTLNTDISNQWSEYHRCHGWFSKWPCRIKHGIEIGGLKVARGAADEALKLAKTLVDHFPIDLDPEVAAIIASRDVAMGILDVAKDAIKGADVIDDFIKIGIDEVVSGIIKNIDIKSASFSINPKAFAKNGSAAKVHIDAMLFGHTVNAGIAMKFGNFEKDIPYDLKQIEIMALYALHYAIKESLDKIPSILRDKIRSALALKFAKAQSDNHKALANINIKPDADNVTAIEMKAQYAAYSQAYLLGKIKKANPLNHERSETFNNELIEVGHTGLCLENDKGRVTQVECKNKSTKFSTVAVDGAPGVDAGLGYMNIKDHNGNCLSPDGKWKTVTKTWDSISFPAEEFQGNSKINMGQCANTKEYYWKVLKHGDGWMQMVNLATNQCLHFEENSALPGRATAVWKPCVGSANQVFRIADDVTPEYHKAGIAMRNDQLGQCLGEAGSNKIVPMVECKQAARYDYMVNIKGDLKFINTKTGNCLKPSGYEIGAKLTEVPCTQLDYQWWEAKEFTGGILIKNAQTKQCTQPPSDLTKHQATQVDCSNRHNSIFTPVKDAQSGPNWQEINNSANLNNNKTSLPPLNQIFQPGTTDTSAYICSFNADAGFITGYYWHGSRECTVPQPNEGEWQKDKYRLLMNSSGVEWLNNDGYKIPNRAIVTGGLKSEATYTCKVRVKYDDYAEHQHTGIFTGWTSDGKVCNVGHIGDYSTNNKRFDILSRTIGTYYTWGGISGGKKPSTSDKLMVSAPVWIIGMDNAPYGWDTKQHNWIKQKGCLKQISVNPKGFPYGIGCDGQGYRWDGKGWIGMGGKGLDIGAGSSTWMIGTNKKPYHWDGRNWLPKLGCIERLDVDSKGNPVAIGCDNVTYYWNAKGWVNMAGGKGLDIGSGESTWIVGMDKAPYKWNGSSWIKYSGCLKRIDVGANGTPWGIGCDNGIYRWNGKGWIKMPGAAKDIGMAGK